MEHRVFKDIGYTLKRSNRKTMSIYVDVDNSITVHAPIQMPIDKLEQIIDEKRFWIHKSITELNELNESRLNRSYVNGEGFLYLGRSYRLKLGENLQRPLTLFQGYFYLDESRVNSAQQYFIRFYKEKGNVWIPKRTKYFSEIMGIHHKQIRILELKKRWASRSEKSLNFHWKLMMAPLRIIDYVIVHELAHYLQPDHSIEFWSQVETILPEHHRGKDWLKKNGASLDI